MQFISDGQIFVPTRNSPGREVFQRLSCMRNCSAPEACPSMEEIRGRTMRYGRECRECIMDECGKSA